MEPKRAWESRTLWAIVLTAGVLAGREAAPPAWRGALEMAEQGLILSGLWFARLGAGRPVRLR